MTRRNSSLDLKIVVLGPAGVGKTCVIHRFCNGSFLTSTLPTIGAGFFPHEMVVNETEVSMTLWDTAGEERFRSVAPSLLRGANGLILVFDIAQMDTFNGIDVYLEMFVDTVEYDTPHLPVLLLANKCDLEAAIEEEVIEKWCAKHDVKHWRKVSAKTGDGIASAMNDFIADFIGLPASEPAIGINVTQKKEEKGCAC